MIKDIGTLYDKICKFKNITGEFEHEIDISDLGIEIDTPTGKTQITHIIKKKSNGLKITFEDDHFIICAKKHIFYQNNKDVYADNLHINDSIDIKDGKLKIKNIENDSTTEFYDISVPYPHMYYDAHKILHHNTLISAVLAKEVSKRGKFLIIVPSRDLVINTAKQLNYLGIDTGTVFEGDRASQYAKPCVVTTWQGILSMCRRAEGKGHHLDDIKKLNKEQTKAYYDKNQKLVNFYKEEINKLYEAQKVDIANAKVELSTLCNGVYGFLFDECHLAKGHLIKEILNKMFPKVQVRFGCTGTVPKDKADRYCLFTSIGPVVDILSSKELQDMGFLAKCEVKMIQLKDTRKFIDFASEKTALSGDENRLSFVSKYTDYIAKTYGNTLILIDRIETGNILFKQLSELKADVVFLQGKDSVKKRTEEYSEINKENNKIIIATAQIASTGINIPRLFNLVLVDYGQSFTKTIQSVGRALRLGSDKNSAYIHDISSTTKYSKEHYKKRKAYYQEQSIPIEEMKLDNWSL